MNIVFLKRQFDTVYALHTFSFEHVYQLKKVIGFDFFDSSFVDKLKEGVDKDTVFETILSDIILNNS